MNRSDKRTLRSHISKLCDRNVRPSMADIEQIASELACSLEDVFEQVDVLVAQEAKRIHAEATQPVKFGRKALCRYQPMKLALEDPKFARAASQIQLLATNAAFKDQGAPDLGLASECIVCKRGWTHVRVPAGVMIVEPLDESVREQNGSVDGLAGGVCPDCARDRGKIMQAVQEMLGAGKVFDMMAEVAGHA